MSEPNVIALFAKGSLPACAAIDCQAHQPTQTGDDSNAEHLPRQRTLATDHECCASCDHDNCDVQASITMPGASARRFQAVLVPDRRFIASAM
jgi:hypothetical protein